MSTITTVVSTVLDALARVPFIAGALTKGTLLVLIAMGLTRLLARAPAAARHLVWSLSVVGLLLLPATALMPWRIELPGLTAVRDTFDPTPTARAAVVGGRERLDDVPDESAGHVIASPAPSVSLDAAGGSETSRLELDAAPVVPGAFRALRDPAILLIVAWLSGTLWMLGRLVVGVANVRRTARESVPADGAEWAALVESAQRSIGVPGAVRIVISSSAAMPFTSGLFRPIIVLPASAEDWTVDRRRSVLVHELAHVRRRDLLTNAIVQLACAVYWFHPLVRLAARRVRIEAERSCDALVVAAGTRASDYASDLLEIARTMRSSATATVALAVARRSDFEGRLLAILAPDCGRNLLTAARASLIALSFAAPAAAIAAAVPTTRVSPNGDVATPAIRETTERTDTGAVEIEPVERVAIVAPPAGASTTSQEPAPQQARGSDTAVPALLSVVNDESAAVRLAAIQALGQQGDPRAIDALVQALRNDTDARVREAAAEALGEIDSPRAVPGLVAALGSEKVGAVRAKVAWALGEIDDPRAVEALGAAVRDPEAQVRREVVWALGELEAPAAVPMLIPALRDSDAETRQRAAEALGHLESPDAIDALSAATKDAEAEVRKNAVAALGEIGDKRALAALSAAVRDAEVEVRREAISAIGNLEDLGSAPPALLAAVRDEDREVRRAAAEALGQIEDEAAVPALIPLTRDTNSDVKRAAVEALAEIGGAQAIEVMAALLKDEDPEIRKLAAQALGKSR
ncbi:MAG: peptidase BlaR1 [Geminicoccaceae bacterium]|nr:peptidase BlaR1 [Geminicoccaceae bacterium]